MKKTLLYLLVLILVCTSACSKEDSSNTGNLTNKQAAFMISSALATNAYGFISRRNDMLSYAKNISVTSKGCGVPDIFAAARQDAINSNIGYNYAVGYNYTVNCINNVQDNLSCNLTYNGSFDATGLSVLDSGSCALSMTDIGSAATNYTFSGTYEDNGTYHTTDGTNLSGDYSINFSLSNYKIAKTSAGTGIGTVTITLTGSVKNKSTFSYTANVEFADGKTFLTIDNIKYSVNLVTAEVIATN